MAENVSRRSVFRASAGAAVLASSASAAPLTATPAAAAPATQSAAARASRRTAAAVRDRLDAKTERRVRNLLGRMTVEEKFGQLQQLTWNPDTGPGEGQNDKAREAAAKGRLGSVLNITGAEECNELQRYAVEESRLGIPLHLRARRHPRLPDHLPRTPGAGRELQPRSRREGRRGERA